MGTLAFGTEDTVTCIQPVELKGNKGESLCLAHKTTTHFFGAGLYMTDDGYVLRIDGQHSYYPLDAAKIEELQAKSLLPRPLPKYAIAWHEWALGYSLWIVLGFAVLWRVLLSKLKARQIQTRAEEAAVTPISYGPPDVQTKMDRYVTDQVAPLLEPGEGVQHQAYVLDRVHDTSLLGSLQTKAFVAVLTNRRLLLLGAKGAWGGIAIKKGKVESIARSRIVRLSVDDRMIVAGLDDGSTRPMWVYPMSFLSTQHKFLLDVPRILAPGAGAAVA